MWQVWRRIRCHHLPGGRCMIKHVTLSQIHSAHSMSRSMSRPVSQALWNVGYLHCVAKNPADVCFLPTINWLYGEPWASMWRVHCLGMECQSCRSHCISSVLPSLRGTILGWYPSKDRVLGSRSMVQLWDFVTRVHPRVGGSLPVSRAFNSTQPGF